MNSAEARPIFIVGCDRSGTTLLRLMLTCHSSVAVPPESPFLREMHRRWGDVRLERPDQVAALCDDLYAVKKFADWRVERPVLQSTLIQHLPLDYAGFVEAVYEEYGREHDPSAVRWGDKNPTYAMDLDLLWRLFPSATIIHIVRDGRAVLNSFRTANRKAGQAIWPESPGAAARLWVRRIDAAAQHRNHPHYIEVFYEKLVGAPEEELRRLCDRLSLTYDPVMLEFAQVNRQEELVPQDRLAWHGATLQPVQVANADRWRQELDPQAASRFELFAGNHLIQYGYVLQTKGLGRFRLVNQTARLCGRLVTRILARQERW